MAKKEVKIIHDENGKFAKGNKGPGRTPIAKGGKPNDPHNLRGLIAERAPAIIAAVAKEAERGDVAADDAAPEPVGVGIGAGERDHRADALYLAASTS